MRHTAGSSTELLAPDRCSAVQNRCMLNIDASGACPAKPPMRFYPGPYTLTSTRDPKDTSVALTTRLRRVAPPPGNFYYVFGRPADHSKRRVLQLRVNLNLYSIFERLACTRRVRYTPHVSAARSAAPAVFITFLRFPRTRLRVLVLHSGFNVLFGFPANPRHVRRAPHASAARSAGPAIFITFLGFPRIRLRVLESHSGFTGARRRHKARSPLLFDVRVLREPNDRRPCNSDYIFGLPADRATCYRIAPWGLQWRAAAAHSAAFSVYSMSESPASLTTCPSRSLRVGGAQRCPRVYFYIFGGPAARSAVLKSYSASREPKTCPPCSTRVADAYRRRRSFYHIFGLPADMVTCYSAEPGFIVAFLVVLRRAAPYSNLIRLPANPRRVRRAPHASAARSAAPTIFITFLSVPRTRLGVTACGGGAQRCLWFLFDVRASHEPNDASVALPTCRRRYAPPPRNFYYIFEGPADHLTCPTLNLYSMLELLATPPCAPDASARPRTLITFLEVPQTNRPATILSQINVCTGVLRAPIHVRFDPPRFLNYVFGLATNRSTRHRPTFDAPSLPSTSREPQDTYGWTLTHVLFGFLEVPRPPRRAFDLRRRARIQRPLPMRQRRDALPVAAAASHRSGILNFGFGLPVSAAIFLLWIWYSREQGVSRSVAPSTRRRHHAINAPDIQLLDFAFPRAGLGMFVLTSSLSHSLRHAAIFLSCLSSKPALSIQILDFKSPRAPSSRRRCPDILLFGFRVPASEVTLHAPARRDCAITPINVPANI
ncbi:hypothetical protein DFH09DRAFT_1452375 [Mycena vulgaris]|nr:hypothetical protein DFH09DRAFT_1452375 [Mycena vulgaris]